MNIFVQHLRCKLPTISLPAFEPWARAVVPRLRKLTAAHRRVVASIGSVLLHALLLLALLPTSPKDLPSGVSLGVGSAPGNGEPYTRVELYATGPTTPSSTKIKTPDNAMADALDAPLEKAKPESEALATEEAQSQLTTIGDTPTPPALVATSEGQEAAGSDGANRGGTTAGAGDNLWSAIAPCWNQIANATTLPVALKITFAADGGLAKPPEIVRAAGVAITPESLKSEAQALAALSQCGVYPMAAGRKDVNVQFPKPN
jgi:hypothetical protein